MANKSIIITIVVILAVIILGGGAIYLYSQKTPTQNYGASNGTPTSQGYNPQTQGKVVFGIKDAAASMGSITSVMITVNEIDLHSQAQGWVKVSDATNQYDLLALKSSGATSLLAQANVTAGTYDQMRLMVSKVVVTQNGVQSEAKLPSGELKIMGKLVVNADKTSTAVFDFMTDQSLHVTGSGKFIFVPVLHVQAQSNTNATVDSNSNVHVGTGHVDTDANEGMDVNGEMKANFELSASTKLDEVNNVVEVAPQAGSDSSVKVTADAAISAAMSNGSLDSATSVTLVTQNGKKVWQVTGLKNLMLTNVYVDVQTGTVISSKTQSGAEPDTREGIKLGL